MKSRHVSQLTNEYEVGVFTLEGEEYFPSEVATYFRGSVRLRTEVTQEEAHYSIRLDDKHVIVGNTNCFKNSRYVGHLVNHKVRGSTLNNCGLFKVKGANKFEVVIEKYIKGEMELFWDYGDTFFNCVE